MKYRLRTGTYFIGFLLLCCLRSEGRSFTHPQFEQLDLKELQVEIERLAANTQPNPSQKLDRIQTLFFLAEAYDFRERIHQASQLRDQLEKLCQTEEKRGFVGYKKPFEGAQVIYTCALNASLRIGRSFQLQYPSLVSRIQALLLLAEKRGADKHDRFYTEGRIYYRLPASFGQKMGKSLLNFHFLKRLRPAASSVDFWLGHVYLVQGNERKAKEFMRQALAKQDTRARLYFEGRYVEGSRNSSVQYRRRAQKLDGLGWGIAPGLFVDPVRGFGGQIVFSDSRIFDSKRSVRVSLTAATKGTYGVGFHYQDQHTIPGVSLKSRLLFGRFAEEFYGSGINASVSNRTSLRVQKLTGGLGLKKKFLDHFFLEVGWKFEAWNVLSSQGGIFGSSNLLDQSNSLDTGAYGKMGFDNRDSFQAPRRGSRFVVGGYFPSASLGSRRSFEKFHLNGSQYLALALRHTLKVELNLESASGLVPLPAFAQLGGSLALAGVRSKRFIDQSAAALSSEYRYELWNSASLMVFGSLATVASRAGDLFSSTIKGGGGGGLILHPNRYHAPKVRVEAGVFASEFVIQARGGVQF